VLDALGAAREPLADGGEALERVEGVLRAVGPRGVGLQRAVRGVGLAEGRLVLERLEATRHLLVSDGSVAPQRVVRVLRAVGPRRITRE